MARGAGGWSLRRDDRSGIYTVRFRHEGQRVHRSTGASDRGAAQKEAARIYAEVVSGRRRQTVGRAAPDLEELCAAWIVQYRAGHAKETADEYERYCASHFLPFFDAAAGITDLACADYATHRLRQVAATTVRKELSALRSFVEWLHEQGYLPDVVRVPGVRKRAVGTPSTERKQVRVLLSATQRDVLIAALPERSRRPKGRPSDPPVPVRAFVVVMAETGLRRATMWRLRAPEHYYRGAPHLTITADVDKARDGRPLPISARARAALDAVCPDEGPIFGRVTVRHWLAEASRHIGLPPHLAGRVSHHDLRHSFLTEVAEASASIAGLQYLAGHRHASTSARYIHATQRAGEEALRAREAAAIGTPNGTRKRATKKAPKRRARESA